MQEFICDYTYKNKKWSFIVYAKDKNDMLERIKAIRSTLVYTSPLDIVSEDVFRHVKIKSHVLIQKFLRLFGSK